MKQEGDKKDERKKARKEKKKKDESKKTSQNEKVGARELKQAWTVEKKTGNGSNLLTGNTEKSQV